MARSRPQIPELSKLGLSSQRTASGMLGSARGQVSLQVYETLRQAILDCSLMPGMALSEQAVSDELQVSRAPVREAFRQLVVEGLLQSIPQRGTLVALLSRARIADAVFVREVIECRAVELAASAPLAQRRKLDAIVKRQASATARKDYATHLATDEDFHIQILTLAGHPHAWGPLRLARTGMNRIRHLAIPELGSNKIAIDHHRTIVEALLAGDGAAASAAMRVHIQSPLVFLDAIQAHCPQYFEVEG